MYPDPMKISPKTIPFFKNKKDNLHCFQASLKMALAVYEPHKTYSFTQLDTITGFRSNKMTWDTQALLWLAKKGFQIKKYSTFEYASFVRRGASYLKALWRPDVYKIQRSHSNLRAEQQRAKLLIQTPVIALVPKSATLSVIERHLQKGWVPLMHVDVSLFDKTKDYSPHTILITSVRKNTVTFHDPGLPPEMSRTVPSRKFARALKQAEVIFLKK